jgi:hypothetical protein
MSFCNDCALAGLHVTARLAANAHNLSCISLGFATCCLLGMDKAKQQGKSNSIAALILHLATHLQGPCTATAIFALR